MVALFILLLLAILILVAAQLTAIQITRLIFLPMDKVVGPSILFQSMAVLITRVLLMRWVKPVQAALSLLLLKIPIPLLVH